MYLLSDRELFTQQQNGGGGVGGERQKGGRQFPGINGKMDNVYKF